MKMGRWIGLLAAATLLVGCGDFWQAPPCTSCTAASFTLANGGNITAAQGSSGTSLITVTPTNSFTGTVALTCTVSSAPSGATTSEYPTCSLSPTSVSITSAAQASTLTVAPLSTSPIGTYNVSVSGSSSSVSPSPAPTVVCVAVGVSAGNCTSAASTSGVFYVLNQTTSQIVALKITSGQPTTIGAITTPTVNPLAIAVAPNGNFLYVSTSTGIYLYTIGSNGALTLGNSGNLIAGDPADTMQVDSTNSWLVEAVNGSTQLYAINVNSSGASAGTPVSVNTTKQPFTLSASTPIQLAISPGDSSTCTGCYVFVALGAGGTEFIRFNPSNPNPFGTSGNPGLVNSNGGDNTVAVDPSNNYLYIGETVAYSGTQTGGLRFFSIASGGITPVGSVSATGGTEPTSIQPSADGKYVYVANGTVGSSSTGSISSFSVTSTGLTFIATATAGSSGQIGLAEDSTGSYLLAVDKAGSSDLQAYTMSSGTLSSAFTSTTGSDPVGAVAIAAAP